MSRAVILPIPGDPYIAQLWLNSWERYWGPDKGQLYAMVNTGLEHPVVDYTIEILEKAGAKVFYKDHMMSHGPAITYLVNECKEDTVFIVEDDFYMMKPGYVSQWFNMVEVGEVDAIVSPRGCTGADIMQKTTEIYGLAGKIEDGIILSGQTNFWPSLVVISRENLLKTDLNFEAFVFKAGEPIDPLNGYAPPEQVCGDTFVWMSLQLRALGLRFKHLDQHRLIDVVNANKWTTPWVHVGSSSTSLNGGLLDENMEPLGSRGNNRPAKFQPVPDEGIRNVFEEKYAWWKICNDYLPIPDNHPAAYFNQVYGDAIERSIKGCNLRPAKITSNYIMFEKLLAPLL